MVMLGGGSKGADPKRPFFECKSVSNGLTGLHLWLGQPQPADLGRPHDAVGHCTAVALVREAGPQFLLESAAERDEIDRNDDDRATICTWRPGSSSR